jgi:hypothetical protein
MRYQQTARRQQNGPTSPAAASRAHRRAVCLIVSGIIGLFLRDAMAEGVSPSAPSANLLDNWLANLAFVVGLVYMCVKLLDAFRTKPPPHQQFAALVHKHVELVHQDDLDGCQASCVRERLDMRQEMGNAVGKVERQIDHLRNAIETQNSQLLARLDKLDERNEERIGHVYETLTPLAPAISATAAKLDNHLADHRAEGKH